MTRRKEAEPLVRVTLNLFESSYARMQDLYPGMGAAKAIRTLVHQHVAQVEAKVARATEDLVPDIDVEIEDGQ